MRYTYAGAQDHEWADDLAHYGVKGMKWGKHKSRVATFVDQRITGASAKKSAHTYEVLANIDQKAAQREQELLEQNSNVALQNSKAITNNTKAQQYVEQRGLAQQGAAGTARAKGATEYAKALTEASLKNLQKDRDYRATISKQEANKASAQTTRQQNANKLRDLQNSANANKAQAASARSAYNKSIVGKIDSGVQGLQNRRRQKLVSVTKKTLTSGATISSGWGKRK